MSQSGKIKKLEFRRRRRLHVLHRIFRIRRNKIEGVRNAPHFFLSCSATLHGSAALGSQEGRPSRGRQRRGLDDGDANDDGDAATDGYTVPLCFYTGQLAYRMSKPQRRPTK